MTVMLLLLGTQVDTSGRYIEGGGYASLLRGVPVILCDLCDREK